MSWFRLYYLFCFSWWFGELVSVVLFVCFSWWFGELVWVLLFLCLSWWFGELVLLVSTGGNGVLGCFAFSSLGTGCLSFFLLGKGTVGKV